LSDTTTTRTDDRPGEQIDDHPGANTFGIDADLLDASPSTGAKGTAGAMHAVYGLGDPEPRATCNPDDDVLKDFFGVSS